MSNIQREQRIINLALQLLEKQIKVLKDNGFVKQDDIVVNTGSTPVQLHLPTNMIKINKVE